MDFKGHLPIENSRCHPLTILDDHSRFALGLQACSDEKTQTVQQRLSAVFRLYGLPERMTMDNGSPWGGASEHFFTPLTAWLIRLGVRVSHSRPYHPQTQGKDERFHRTLKLELLRMHTFRHLDHAQSHFDTWRNTYNLERPHESLGMQVPASRYRPSPRSFPESLPPVEYDSKDVIRKVQEGGEIWFKSRPLQNRNRLPRTPSRSQTHCLRQCPRCLLLPSKNLSDQSKPLPQPLPKNNMKTVHHVSEHLSTISPVYTGERVGVRGRT